MLPELIFSGVDCIAIAMPVTRFSRARLIDDSPGSVRYAAVVDDWLEKAKDVLMKIEEGITPIYAKLTG